MGKTYAWHPGSRALARVDGIAVALLPDESISSWLVRCALQSGCDPLVYTGAVWPKWRPWTLDIDRGFDIQKRVALSRKTGVDADVIANAFLQGIETYPAAKPRAQGLWSWIVALGLRNRRRATGSQFCPACLRSDKVPYFRIQWRYALELVCIQHGCYLQDSCPNCNSPVSPHLLKAERRSIAICHICGVGLAQRNIRKADATQLTFAKRAREAVLQGVVQSNWFTVVRSTLKLIRRSYIKKDLKAALDYFHIQLFIALPNNTGLTFELMRLDQRIALLQQAAPIILGVSAYLNGEEVTNSPNAIVIPLIKALSSDLSSTTRIGPIARVTSSAPRSSKRVLRAYNLLLRRNRLAQSQHHDR